jgi:hypothetical protein
VACSCECDAEPYSYIKCFEFLECLVASEERLNSMEEVCLLFFMKRYFCSRKHGCESEDYSVYSVIFAVKKQKCWKELLLGFSTTTWGIMLKI